MDKGIKKTYMRLFKTKNEKELESIIQQLEINMSNNYKDNARDDLKKLEETLHALRESGGIKPAILSKYESILVSYKEKMKGYSHREQKPYWH